MRNIARTVCTGPVTCHAKSGPGENSGPVGPVLATKPGPPGPPLAAKSGPLGPLLSAKSGPTLPKVDRVKSYRRAPESHRVLENLATSVFSP